MAKSSGLRRIGSIGYHLMLTALAAVFIYPLYLLVVLSLKTSADILLRPFALPRKLNLGNYRTAWVRSDFGTAFANSAFITLLSVLLIVLIGSMAAFVLSRRRGTLVKLAYAGFVAGLAIPVQLNIIPLYVTMKSLHLTNTYTGIIVLYATLGIPFTVFLYTGFFGTLPRELDEAATIDGCSQSGIFFRILLPLLAPVTATVAILQGLTYWNQFFIPSIFMPSTGARLVPTAVYAFVGQYVNEWDKIFPIMVCGIAPVVLIYVLLQRFVIDGMTAGSIKG